MIGVDITKISRFKQKSENFVRRILSEEEYQNDYINANDKPLFLATRWAIKEALFKADNSLYSFSKINIKKDGDKYFLKGYEISTSNEDDLVIAFVITK